MYYIVDAQGEPIGLANGAVNTGDLARLHCIAVFSDLTLPPSEVEIAGFPAAPSVIPHPATPQPVLKLSTTATDADGDGLPELKADGHSSAVLHLTAQSASGDALRSPANVTIRTTAGRLSARTVSLENGAGFVLITSGFEPVTAEITASAVGFDSAVLRVEFVE